MDSSHENIIAAALGGAITPGQRNIGDLVLSGSRYTLVRSCNGYGKTAFLAALALDYMWHYDDITVIAISKNMTHCQRNFMKELKKQHKRIPLFAESKVNKFNFSPLPGRNLFAISPNVVEAAQGYHSEHLLILVDEGTGIPEFIYDALTSCMSGSHSQMVVTYNPISTDAFVYKAETDLKWPSVGLSAMDHPNVQFGSEVVKGAITREQVDAMLRAQSMECDPRFPGCVYIPWQKKYYQVTPYIAVRLLGQYHLMSHDGFIDPHIITSAYYQPTSEWTVARDPKVPLYIGIDISRGIKDRTIATVLSHTGNVLGFQEYYETNLSVLAEKIYQMFPREYVAIDDTGCGSGVTDRLTQLGHKNIFPIHFGSSPRNFYQGSLHPTNARTEMLLLLENDLRSGFLKIPEDHTLTRELTAWKINSVYGGQYCRADYKSTIQRRLSASPDKSDSFALANYCRHIQKRMSQSFIF